MRWKPFPCAVCKQGSQHGEASSFRDFLFSTRSGGEGCINSEITHKKQKRKHGHQTAPAKSTAHSLRLEQKAERRPLLGTCVTGTQSFAALLPFVHDLEYAEGTDLGLHVILTSRWIPEGR